MSLPYPLISNFTSSLNTGSYLTQTDYSLFNSGIQYDLWYGNSNKDAIELSVFNLKNELLSWIPISNIGEFKTNSLTCYNNKNESVSYDYQSFTCDLPLYKNQKILVDPIQNVSSTNITSGNYIFSYQLTRYLAGSPENPLVIKDISNSKTEIKLIPSKEQSDSYTALCLNKILLSDVSPLYIKSLSNCPYDTIYKSSQLGNESSIELVKNMFFISDDGKFIEFLKSLYEDLIKYSSQSNDRVDSFIRIQGIRTYFNNYLVSNTNSIIGFDDIKMLFEKFVSDRLDILFLNYKSPQYNSAKQYLFDVFVKYFFDQIHNELKYRYEEKYLSPLKNALCFGAGKYLPIINISYLDERSKESDPLTLLIKLQSPLDSSLSIKSQVWVSNIGLIPILFNCIIKQGSVKKSILISAPDFTLTQDNSSISNTNVYHTNDSLNLGDDSSDNIDISKKISELNVDYSSLDNFILFSSSELRHNIFKNKMITLSSISSSLSSLESSYSSSGYSYPYYTTEKESYKTQQSDLFASFDGFESYLFKTGHYYYDPQTKTFSSSSFVDLMDLNTKQYDKNNRDSLVNNTPEHIISDSENDEYLIFLSMVGHYFDNLYLYMKSLPLEKTSENKNKYARSVLEQMLKSFGWKTDDALESATLSDNFLDSSLNGKFDTSANERSRQVWNRILNTLPLIYKTKGTSACVRLILSCYGIPSTLIHLREYGGNDYSDTDKTSYTIEEKIFLLTFKGYNEYLKMPFTPTLQTLEFKVSVDPDVTYTPLERIPVAVKYSDYNNTSSLDWSLGIYKENKKYTGRVYFTLNNTEILSDEIPIFNGDVFNVMVRKNDPNELFEYNATSDIVPTKYDLWVKKNADSRTIFSSLSSKILTKAYNVSFSNAGFLYVGNYQQSASFKGNIDKVLLWQSPIKDATYDDHCNNINSYSYTGSGIPHEVLFFRLNYDYPQDLSGSSPQIIVNSNEHYSSSISSSAHNFRTIAYSSSIDNCFAVSHSVYPYQFRELNYDQTFTITSYGPNKFKNEKIQKVEQRLTSRLDPIDRSTVSANEFSSPDSNQIGLFVDPNDYKNKDIFRYLGNYGVVGLVGDPSLLYSDSYGGLKQIRNMYNDSGNKRVLYNEFFTLYKFYFDKTIFDTIKQVIPSRNTILTGILIEPTVLERPKYQHKRISSDACILEYSSSSADSVTSSYLLRPQTLSLNDSVYSAGTIQGDFISVNFRMSKDLYSSQLYEHIPFFLGPYKETDPIYQQYLDVKPRLIFVSSGWIKKYPDFGEIGNVETHDDWPIPAPSYGPTIPDDVINVDIPIGGNIKFAGTIPGFYSTGSYYYLKNCHFYVYTDTKKREFLNNLQKDLTDTISISSAKSLTVNYPSVFNSGFINDIENRDELGVHCDDIGKIIETKLSGSVSRYLIKKWNKDSVYFKTGEYSKPQTMVSQSLYLYSTTVLNAPFFENIVYTSSVSVGIGVSSLQSMGLELKNINTGGWILPDYSPQSSVSVNGWTFYHNRGTFKQRPNSTKNNLFGGNNGIISKPFNSYFEVFSGYSRNHLTNKRILFSPESIHSLSNTSYDRYIKSRQTIDSTVNDTGLEDNTLPIQTINVSNVNVVKTDNVLG